MEKLKNQPILKNDKSLKLNFNSETRTLTHYISTEDINCYGYRLLNSGIRKTRYDKNPIVLWQHELEGGLCSSAPKPKDLIIGSCLGTDIDNKGILAHTQFADTELGNDIMELNASGLLNAWSVRWEFETDEETDMLMIQDIPTVKAWEMLEYSSVVLPGNPSAVNELNQMLAHTKSDRIKRFLAFDLAKAEVYTQINALHEKLEKLGEKPDNSKEITDFKNEIKTELKRFQKHTTEKLMEFALSMQNLKGNLHSELLTSIPDFVNRGIRKAQGKLD